uniref:Fe2OG dioxygenase domain-containing protein n=1 Tax=Brassica campestris TaxID=3711 RepID=M4C9G9_BRACM
MGSDSTPQLPVIHLSDQTLKPGSEKWVEVRSDVRKALEDYGAFEVSYDRVSEELKESVLEAMKELFQLPVEAKRRNVSPKPYTGYMTHNGISESLGIQDANVLEKVNEFTQLLRPDCEGNKSTSERIHKFSEKMAELDVMVRRMVFESFGIEDYFDENLKSMNYLLYQYEIEGLEVLTKDEKWIRVKPSHNTFVVIAGDSLHALMNGRLFLPFHRVRVTEKKKTRYSIGLFSTPNRDYIIEPPKELVDEQHPRVFKPLTYVDLMSFYHTEVGRRARSTLHAYCAVSGA